MTGSTPLSAAATTALSTFFDAKDVVTPSINYAVFDREGIIFQHGIGEFQRDGRVPTAGTVYRIASMSKSFCVASVLVLVERGLLGFDDAVADHVPEFSNYRDPFGVEEPITVRMLMSNSSGLPEDNGWADHHLAISREDLLQIVASGFRFADYPDVGYQYSNVGFALLGFIVENITGETFTGFATRTLLEPLGLTRTRYGVDEYSDRAEGGESIAHGYTTFDKGESWIDRPFTATGAFGSTMSMFSTVGDIATWSAWLSRAFVPSNSDDTILSRASRRRMQRIFTPIATTAKNPARAHFDNSGYGLGLRVEQDTRFGDIAQHSGGLPGFGSNMRWHTTSGLGVVVFNNTNGNPVAQWAAELLRIVLEDVDAPAKLVTLWPETVAAATAIEAAILGSGRVLDADTPFSTNVASDVPAAVRDAALATLVTTVGGLVDTAQLPPLAGRLGWAVAASHLAWTIPGVTGSLECRIELTDTRPALVQRVDIAVFDPAAGGDLVGRHYLPVVG